MLEPLAPPQPPTPLIALDRAVQYIAARDITALRNLLTEFPGLPMLTCLDPHIGDDSYGRSSFHDAVPGFNYLDIHPDTVLAFEWKYSCSIYPIFLGDFSITPSEKYFQNSKWLDLLSRIRRGLYRFHMRRVLSCTQLSRALHHPHIASRMLNSGLANVTFLIFIGRGVEYDETAICLFTNVYRRSRGRIKILPYEDLIYPMPEKIPQQIAYAKELGRAQAEIDERCEGQEAKWAEGNAQFMRIHMPRSQYELLEKKIDSIENAWNKGLITNAEKERKIRQEIFSTHGNSSECQLAARRECAMRQIEFIEKVLSRSGLEKTHKPVLLAYNEVQANEFQRYALDSDQSGKIMIDVDSNPDVKQGQSYFCSDKIERVVVRFER